MERSSGPTLSITSPLLVNIAELTTDGVERRLDGDGLPDHAEVDQIVGGDGFVGCGYGGSQLLQRGARIWRGRFMKVY